MATIMSVMRKDNLTKFNELLPNASSKHIDRCMQIAAINEYDKYIPILLAHPNLTQEGFELGLQCAIRNRRKETIKLFVEDARTTTDMVVKLLLDMHLY